MINHAHKQRILSQLIVGPQPAYSAVFYHAETTRSAILSLPQTTLFCRNQSVTNAILCSCTPSHTNIILCHTVIEHLNYFLLRTSNVHCVVLVSVSWGTRSVIVIMMTNIVFLLAELHDGRQSSGKRR